MINHEKNRRVVVTGLGVVSSIGIGWQEFWSNLLIGKSGISRVRSFDTSNYDRHYAGEIKDFNPSMFMTKRQESLFGRASQFAIAASKLAVKDSGFSIKENPKVAVCIGTTTGEQCVLEEFATNRYKTNKPINIFKISSATASALSCNVARVLKLKGINRMFGTACAAGNYSIGYAYDLIRTGRADYCLAGGADGFSRLVFTGFQRLYAIAPKKCQPFDKHRKGMIPAEGAGMLFLETFETAKSRNAPIYAEIAGYGLSCDATHMTNPNPNIISKSILRALKYSSILPQQIQYISAHGTGTKENDKAECEAVYQVFQKKIRNIPMSSIKSMIGHTMGAASALESISCCLVVKNWMLPPTINFEEQDSECEIDCIPNSSRQSKIEIALNNSQAFGGNNACVLIRRVAV